MNGDRNIANPPETQAGTPRVAGVALGPAVAALLYGLLVASAALALWAQQVPGALPGWLEGSVPWIFLAFTVAFSLYRVALVRARRYPASKALFQIGTAILFFMLLLPRSQPRGGEVDELSRLLRHGDPAVRALAAEAVRYRAGSEAYGRLLAERLGDSDARVRAEAHRSLVKLNGADLGPAEDPAAVRAWKARFP
jgi:hypothetical protein